jgi:hypothetical protein
MWITMMIIQFCCAPSQHVRASQIRGSIGPVSGFSAAVTNFRFLLPDSLSVTKVEKKKECVTKRGVCENLLNGFPLNLALSSRKTIILPVILYGRDTPQIFIQPQPNYEHCSGAPQQRRSMESLFPLTRTKWL